MSKNLCYLNSNDKKQCTGCTACKSICPKGAIEMILDDEGFYYPKINKNKCINCHLCEKVCPFNKEITKIKPTAYSYITNNEEELLKASSGGAFGDIVNAFYEEGKTIIYGCIFDKNNKAVHIGVRSKDIDLLKKSKYVQSDLKNIFKEVKNNLLNGDKVVFSGTPCQISGLKTFLNKEYENLLLIDIICHGVPSQKLLDIYLNEEEKRSNLKISKINFREKIISKNGKYNSRNLKITFCNDKSVIKGIKQSSYLKGFHDRLFYRPSCYVCNFSRIDRLSDLTIADCWGMNKNDSSIDIHKGLSCIIINSEKGQKVFNKLNGTKKNLPLEFVIDNNESYAKPTKIHKNRDSFFENLKAGKNFEELVNKYTKKSLIKRGFIFLKRKIKNLF